MQGLFRRGVAPIAVLASLVAAVCGPGVPARAQGLIENFDDFNLEARGFVFINNSAPPPTEAGGWVAGQPIIFPAQSGADDSYIANNFQSVGDADPPGGIISDWMLTPSLTLINGDIVSFYTRTSAAFNPDRLEVRLSLAGDSANVGTTPESVGDFSTLLLSVNPDLLPGPENYPTEWTQFTATLTGLPDTGANGRVGFRYFVTDAGASSDNGDYIGIDTLRVGPVVAAPEPAPLTLLLPVFVFTIGAMMMRSRFSGSVFSALRKPIL